MLFKKKIDLIMVDTLIGANTFFTGNIELKGTIKIAGRLEGDINSEGDIIVAEGASIVGNLFGNNIIISGDVEGNVMAHEQLRLTPSGNLNGNMHVTSLITDEGATFHGKCEMLEKNFVSNFEEDYVQPEDE